MRSWFVWCLVLIAVGCFALSAFSYFQAHFLSGGVMYPQYSHAKQASHPVGMRVPRRLQIKELEIDVAVVTTSLENDDWQAPKHGIAYLASSPLPGYEGNSIFYGHNWRHLLRDLPQARVGQHLFVVDTAGQQQSFTISQARVIEPGDTSILAQTNDRRITLYTCTGFLDTKRFVVVAQAD